MSLLRTFLLQSIDYVSRAVYNSLTPPQQNDTFYSDQYESGDELLINYINKKRDL